MTEAKPSSIIDHRVPFFHRQLNEREILYVSPSSQPTLKVHGGEAFKTKNCLWHKLKSGVKEKRGGAERGNFIFDERQILAASLSALKRFISLGAAEGQKQNLSMARLRLSALG